MAAAVHPPSRPRKGVLPSDRVRAGAGLCSVAVKRALLVLPLVLRLTLPAMAASEVPEQTITPIPPDTEQRIEPLGSPDEQRVQALDPEAVQDVTGGTKNPVRRGFDRAAKVVVGVLAAGVSIAAMAAMLLLL